MFLIDCTHQVAMNHACNNNLDHVCFLHTSVQQSTTDRITSPGVILCSYRFFTRRAANRSNKYIRDFGAWKSFCLEFLFFVYSKSFVLHLAQTVSGFFHLIQTKNGCEREMCIVHAFHEQRSTTIQFIRSIYERKKSNRRMVAAMHIRVRDPDPDHLYSEYLHFI